MKHIFSPEIYHLTIGPHEPVLTVLSGDTIVTSTIDAAGKDVSGHRVSERGNPQTGPFFVEGAMPGDVLSVALDKVWPNRRDGFCRPNIAPNVLEPSHFMEVGDNEPFNFILDFDQRVAAIENPSPFLQNMRVPIRPMIGCFGVAPERGQFISTATSGNYGGNMDYRGFTPGVTAYFPIFEEGALFHIGDGHAYQADGEILGTGIEISMDVTFTLTVVKDRAINWPRGENEKYIFATGNVRPMDQAIQHATSEMLRWLTNEYGLSVRDANIILGMHVEYDVGNVFDPAYTMVCRIPKSVLPSPMIIS
jgi:acetamidase/formamidase